ncbi:MULTISPECIES: ATP-binding protein [unclassified Fusibacter]|uniref:ATP-binding protein n=1 Tax=unclassified Fusibacter TaxID=2624464 RepID=UPI001012F943|nr:MULTISPECIES: transporter substrate-binding domain-containing protein [unclassified Fusibacter]MCK8058267.1 transporter substrate-binding domain-containing protein [Fusibacter sp. A2]NPE20850.1 transporter substrate-binding domain-containing protein [Fusibacter sp. A1]RXV63054.1 PAS domain S-box protein [Fusibacter sp. A1]
MRRSARLRVVFQTFSWIVLFALFSTIYADVTFTKEEMNWMEEHPVIKYAPDLNYPPFEFKDSDDTIKGIVPDYLKRISEITGLEFEVAEYAIWNDALESLKNNEIDLVTASETGDRKPVYGFSESFIDIPAVIVVRQDNPDIRSMKDLEGKTISTVNGWFINEVVRDQFKTINTKVFDNMDQALNAVSLGEVDAIVVNLGTASYKIQENRILNLKVIENSGISYSLSFAVRKEHVLLLSILNKSLQAIDPSEARAIENEWTTVKRARFYETSEFLTVIGITAVLIVLMWLWVALLKREVDKRTRELSESLSEAQSMKVDRARSLEQLTANKNLLNAIIDLVPYFIFIKNSEGVFLLVNRAMAAFYGLSPAEMIGKKLTEILPFIDDKEQQFYIERDREVLANGKELMIPYENFRNQFDQQGIYKVYKACIAIESESPNCILTVAVDMTEEFNAKKELEEHQRALLEAELQLADLEKKATLGSMVGGITHEINNPVGISVTALSHLKYEHEAFKRKMNDGKLNQKELMEYLSDQDEAISILEMNINRAVDMIQSFKKMSVDQLSEAKSNFDLCDTVDHVIKSLSHQWKRQGHRILFTSDCPIVIESYPGSYSQVFTNLILNSIIHGFEDRTDGTVTIEIQKTDEHIHIRYKDDGKGMTKEHLALVFQPYFTTKRSQGGSGLGMQVIYNVIVRTLHGTIAFDSEVGQGVTCEMKVPVYLRE